MECEYQIKGTTLRIFLPQELDHHVSARLREEADLMVETHFIRTIIFDFSGTDWMDSSGIGVILGRYKNMKLSGGHVYAVHLNERMKKIFAMSGMEHLMGRNKAHDTGKRKTVTGRNAGTGRKLDADCVCSTIRK